MTSHAIIAGDRNAIAARHCGRALNHRIGGANWRKAASFLS
jgi:hypothetical protein